MRFWRRKRTTAVVPNGVVISDGLERAKAEARNVHEKRWTVTPEMLETWCEDDITRVLSESFEYVTEAKFVRPSPIDLNGERLTLTPDDGTRYLIIRGVLRDE